jgi:ribonuclease P protein component
MKKKYIVKMREEFNCLIKTGICSKNKYFVLYHLPNNKSYDRFGISVGKKIGNAVTRNKYKRKIRSIIDKYRKDYINYQDYIIILRGSALSASFQDLEESLIFLLKKEKPHEQ